MKLIITLLVSIICLFSIESKTVSKKSFSLKKRRNSKQFGNAYKSIVKSISANLLKIYSSLTPKQDLSNIIGYSNGQLQFKKDGQYTRDCSKCTVNNNRILKCTCSENGVAKQTSLDISSIVDQKGFINLGLSQGSSIKLSINRTINRKK